MVIEIEQPQPKIQSQGWLPDGATEREPAFDSLNRNNRSLGLNLKMEGARKVFYRLAEKAHVVLESFRPRVRKRLAQLLQFVLK